MPNLGQELHLWRFKRVVVWDLDFDLERSPIVRRLWRARDEADHVSQVGRVGRLDGDARVDGICLDVGELLEEATFASHDPSG